MLPTEVQFSWTEWHAHPSVVIGLLTFTALYLLGVGPLRKRFQGSEAAGSGEVALFLTGVLVLFVALLSPIHELGDKYLFSAHMVQHLLLTLVSPPLLLAGAPPWLIRPLIRGRKILPVLRFITRPIPAFLIFNFIFALWHVPALYDGALRDRGIHILEHILFIGGGILLWWPIMSRMTELPRPSYLLQMVYLVAQPTIPTILGALITFSDAGIYEWYAAAPRIWGTSVVSDQQIGGIIMWVPGGLFFVGALAVIFLIWANQEDASNRPTATGGGP